MQHLLCVFLLLLLGKLVEIGEYVSTQTLVSHFRKACGMQSKVLFTKYTSEPLQSILFKSIIIILI